MQISFLYEEVNLGIHKASFFTRQPDSGTMTRVVVPRGGPPSTSQSRAAATSTSSPSVPPPPPLPPSLILPVLSSPTQRCSSSSLCKEEDSEVLTEALPSFSPDVELIDSRRASKLASRLGTLNIYSEADSSGREETRSLENSTAFVSGTEAERVKELPIAGYELDKHSHSQPDSSVSQVPSSVPAASESSNPEGSRAGTGQHAVITRTLSGSSSAPLSTKAAGSSRRVNLAGSKPGVTFPRISKSRASPNSSPRAHGEDGYNSADESNPWTSEFEDDEERERHFEIELRRVKALEVKRMAADGNCLFRAVADQVYGDPEMFEETRQMCIDYMEKERDHFSQFVTEGFTAYCKRKRRDKVYGNNLEIQAMAEMYNRPIHIYSYSTDPINICHGHYETDLPPIRLSYHRGNHYNSLHDPSRPAVGAGLGFGSLRGRNVDRDQVKAAIRAQQDQQIDNALVAEGRYYSDLELTEQEIERMVMEASRAEYLAEERNRQLAQSSEETSSSAGGEPSTSGAASRGTGSAAGSQVGGSVGLPDATTIDAAMNRNSNVRMLLSMGFNYFRVMEACSVFGDDVNNMLCYLLETDSLGESMYRMKGKAAEK